MELLSKSVRCIAIMIAFVHVKPVFAAPLEIGIVLSDEISVVGEVDEHTFTANAGDSVALRVADTETTPLVNSSFLPRVELIDPNGVYVDGGQGALVGSVFERVLISGEYTVRVFDNSGGNDEVGSYNLYYTKAPVPTQGGIPLGVAELSASVDVISETIDLGDIDTYAFDGNAGDNIALRVADIETTDLVNAAFLPRVEIYSPDGAFLDGGQGSLVGSVFETLTVSGTYTVLVYDNSGGDDAIGAYNLYFANMPGSNEGGVLPIDDVTTATIDLGDIDSYTFFAGAGESIVLKVADIETTEFVNAAFLPRVELYAPDGSFVDGGQGSLVGSVFETLTVGGTYTILVYDNSGGDDASGEYNLYFARAPGSNEGNGISGGDTILGVIDLGDIDSFAFTPDSAGVSVILTLSDLDGAGLLPRMELYAPSGAFFTSDQDANVAQISATLIETGQYTLLVYDNSGGDDAIGNYQLTAVGDITGVFSGPTCNGLPITVDLNLGQTPGPGSDVVLGTPGNDDIRGRAGNDTICGMGGNDFIHGNSGDDWIDGGDGVDNIRGGQGNDILFSGKGATVGTSSRVFGGTGDDSLFGDSDADDLRGGRGEDVLSGEGGADLIIGNEDDDVLFGGRGADTLRGGLGENDELFGEGGNDSLDGGSGANDSCNGGGQGGDTNTNCEVF